MTANTIQIIEKLPMEAQHILIPVPENFDIKNLWEKWMGTGTAPKFSGKLKEKLSWINPKGQRFSFLGIGPTEKPQKIYKAFQHYAYHHVEDAELCYILLDPSLSSYLSQVGHGLRLASYRYTFFKKEKAEKQASFYIIHEAPGSTAEQMLQEAIMSADSQMESMKLVDMPSNHKTPLYLANWAKASGKKYGYEVNLISGKEITETGLHAFWAVGKGSENPPYFIVMEYKPETQSNQRQKLGLVGKGITFDTGGISLKPPKNMHYMKSDMGGAAAVFGAVELAAKLKLDIELTAIVPAAENSVDERSVKPGDVIDSYSEKSIEVIDTDAEGRLVLADGLAYMQKNFKPDILIDLATLTGSCVRALGYHAAGLFSNNDKLKNEIVQAGEKVGDRVWPLPLWEEYGPEMDSDVADIKNLGSTPVAGAITAAKFLEFFIEENQTWAHLDIAGVAFGDSEFSKAKGATGYGVRLLTQLMKQLIQNKN